MYVVPVTLLLVFVLLYLNTGSLIKTAIVALAVPFSAIGAIWYIYLLGYNTSIAVWVGLIAHSGWTPRRAWSCCCTSIGPTSRQSGWA